MTQEEYLQKMSVLDDQLVASNHYHRVEMRALKTKYNERIARNRKEYDEDVLARKNAHDIAVAKIVEARRQLRADWIAGQNAAALQAEHCDVGDIDLFEALRRNLEPHQMRQAMTETFYNWMNEWMAGDARFDTPFVRSEMMESYLAACSSRERVYVSPQKFWLCLVLWCRYHGLALNPHLPLNDEGLPRHDKCNDTEYITIGTSRVENTNL